MAATTTFFRLSQAIAAVLLVLTAATASAQTLVNGNSQGVTILFQSDNWIAPKIHYNAGSGWTTSPGMVMDVSSDTTYTASNGWFQASISSASSLEFVFNDGAGSVWDNNNSKNYKVTSQGTYTVVSKVSALSSGTLVKPNDGTGLHILFQAPYWTQTYIHYNAGSGWTTAPGVQMGASSRSGKFSSSNGWWQFDISAASFEFVFNDGNGHWENNNNNNFKLSSAGTYAYLNTNTYHSPTVSPSPTSTPVPGSTTSPSPSTPTTPTPSTVTPQSTTPPAPSGYVNGPGYKVVSASETNGVLSISLSVNPTSDSTYGSYVQQLLVQVYKTQSDSVRVKITDKNSQRWEVPSKLYPKGSLGGVSQASDSTDALYDFSYNNNPFTFKVTRKSDGYVIFDSYRLPLVVKDQYLQIATVVNSDMKVYGIGESTRDSFKMNTGDKQTLWARDQGAMVANVNLYGSHPFFLGLNGQGKAHGVLLLNSNGMDVTLLDGMITYQTIGGILDFSIVVGPAPSDVVAQYTSLIGRPKLMPYWSYGFHQCRWGYKSTSALREVVDKYASNNLPLDVVWADIDYMKNFHDFTLDPDNFKLADMQNLMTYVHGRGQKFVPIIDPGIPDDTNDYAYTKGLSMGIFIKNTNGNPYLGQVWPGPTVFPDFFHPNSTSYWQEQMTIMHNNFAYDGIWIDMNELANFCPGTTCVRQSGVTCPNTGSISAITTCCLSCTGDGNKYDNPPFAINNVNSKDAIYNKAISTSAIQYGSIRQYDSHNLYGLTEAIATNAAQESITGKRSFVLSRSTFPGSGVHAAHWTGDNAATWNDIRWSIPTILKFGLFGIPMVGSDICGFSGSTTMELCARWTALGSFYPFARNHNNLEASPQETYVWPEVVTVGRKFIGMRYQLLPYLYTLGYHAHMNGNPIARALLHEFPADTNTHTVDRQFMLGNALLVTPVLYQGATSVTGYYPAGVWYNIFDYSRIVSMGLSTSTSVSLYDMPVHVRGGTIIPMHQAALTSAAARLTPFTILVALPSSGSATGDIYLDDGVEIAGASSTIASFTAAAGSFTSKVSQNLYTAAATSYVSKIIVLGVSTAATKVSLGSIGSYNSSTLALTIDLSSVNQSIASDFSVTWS